jgi:hypothetical protein
MNIWDNYFKDYNVKTAHSYLTDMEQSLAVATKGILFIEVTSFDYQDEDHHHIFRTRFSVRSKPLGNYGFEILTVDEPLSGRWPVKIENSFTAEEITSTEEEFMKNIQKIIETPVIKKRIENLFSQSVK